MPRPRSPLSRRDVLFGGLGVAAVTLTGCDAVEGILGEDDPAPSSPTVAPADPDADATLADTLGTACATVAALAAATGAVSPKLAPLGTRLSAFHTAHAAELGVTTAATAPAVSSDPVAALTTLKTAEADLQTRLIEGAAAAESGGLAQLLASIAAAIAQQRAALT